MMNNNRFKIILLLLVALLSVNLAKAENKAAVSLRVFLYDKCGGCASADTGCRDCELINEYYVRLSNMLKSYIEDGKLEIKMRNLMYESHQKEYATLRKQFKLDESISNIPPQYFIGEAGWGEFVFGEENEKNITDILDKVLKNMPSDGKASIDWEDRELLKPRSDDINDIEDTDSLIIYFYKDYCPYCAELKPLIEGLPDFVYFEDGTKSRIRLISLEKQDPRQMQVVQRYYDKLFVHPDRQYVPMLIIGDKNLFLTKEIVPNILNYIIQGEGTKTDREPLNLLKD